MKRLAVTQKATVEKMVNSLINHANARGITLYPVKDVNDLDTIFNDGGEARCEQFADLADDYALQFGSLESPAFERAQWSCIQKALKSLPSVTVTLYIAYVASGFLVYASENLREVSGFIRYRCADDDKREFAVIEVTIKNPTKDQLETIANLKEHGERGYYSDGYEAASAALSLGKRFKYMYKGSRFYW